jgi:hypothetical protein
MSGRQCALEASLVGEIDVAGPELARSLTDLCLADEYRPYFRPAAARSALSPAIASGMAWCG